MAPLDTAGAWHRSCPFMRAASSTGPSGQSRLGILPAPEAEHDRRRAAQLLREVRQRRDSDPSADEERPGDIESVAVTERPEHRDPVAGLQLTDGLRPRPDRVDEEGELPGR